MKKEIIFDKHVTLVLPKQDVRFFDLKSQAKSMANAQGLVVGEIEIKKMDVAFFTASRVASKRIKKIQKKIDGILQTK